jgi:uncharacterized membrane protein
MSSSPYQQLAAHSRKVVIFSYALLLLLFTINTLITPSCERQPNTSIWVLHCLPLLIFLPGIIKHSLRGLAWMCFVLLGYFMAAVLGAFTCPSYWVSLELAVIVCLFIASMFNIRWQARYLRSQESAS